MCAEKNLGIWLSFKISKDVPEIDNDKELLETDNELLEETPKLEHSGKDVAIFSQIQQQEKWLIKNSIHFHEDIKDLIWFADSPLLNIDPKQFIKTVKSSGLRLDFTYSGYPEPSMIFTKYPIEFPKLFSDVEPLGYYPSYIELDPLQKGMYIKFLENPYKTKIDIGYLFLLYYGLERHLLLDDWEKSADVILKLRKCHKHKSFQSYSASALILTAIYREQGELALRVISELEENQFLPITEYLLCASSFNLHITSKELMYYAEWFGFHNTRYIKNQTELFSKTLTDFIQEDYHRDYVLISDFLTDKDIAETPPHKIKIFANVSLSDVKIEVPFLSENEKLRNAVCSLLQKNHDFVKKYLADQRKACKQM